VNPNQPNLEEMFGKFLSHGLNRDECDIIAIQLIPNAIREDDAALFGKKWYDYRRLHPTQATCLFVDLYRKAYSKTMQTFVDQDKGKYATGVKGKTLADMREAKAFWRTRQKIDDTGMRYDFFLSEAMNWCIANGWKRPPRPAHLANNDIILAALNAWELECRAKIQYPVDDFYKAVHFFGHKDQIAYERWLVGQIKKRNHPKYGLNAALYITGNLRIEAAKNHFEGSTIEEAIELSMQE
jgi:hypothetical protein